MVRENGNSWKGSESNRNRERLAIVFGIRLICLKCLRPFTKGNLRRLSLAFINSDWLKRLSNLFNM